MKKSITEGFIEDLFKMIAKGRVDSKVKKMMKHDPKFAKNVKDMRDLQQSIEDRIAKRYGK